MKVSMALREKNTDKAIKICLKYLDKNIEETIIYEKIALIYLIRCEWHKSLNYSYKALTLNKNSVQSWSSVGVAYKNLGRYEKALAAYREALKICPEAEFVLSNMGLVFWKLNRYEQAKLTLKKALKIRRLFPEAIYNLGKVYESEKKLDHAIFHFKEAIKIKNNYPDAIVDLSICLDKKGKIIEAINLLENSINKRVISTLIIKNLIYLKGKICDWSKQDITKELIKDLGINGLAISPMGLMAYEDSPEKHLLRAKRYWEQNFKEESKKFSLNINMNNKINIGYFSANFHEHAVMHLLTRTLELHNKDKFSIYCFSLGNTSTDRYTKRIIQSVNDFIDVKNYTDKEIVKICRDLKLNIAVDLMGYSKNSRPKIFSYRAAPIQISYLGFPGSMGAKSIDYLIADKYLIPEENKKYYSEKIIYLPTCYQCNDDKLLPSSFHYNKKILGIKNNDFIFSCFNTNYKITQKEFYIWISLLKKIKYSVLWLSKSNQFSEINLKNILIKEGIDPKRIIFSETIKIEDHLSRLKIADLHLDTFNYNAGATALFSLKAGVPIITKTGQSYTARMATSILKSLGLDELVTSTEHEYENLACSLARDRESLNKIKLKIKELLKTEFFNSSNFTRNLEEIYIKIYNKDRNNN